MSSKLKQLVRMGGLKLLRATGRDICIRHHWVPGQKLKIHSFKHKGYWWHGKKREAQTLASIAKFVGPGDSTLDVGAHVGYFTTYLAHLVGPNGRVVAFEPGTENLVYTRTNTESLIQVRLDSRGISNYTGDASFFVESLTGQNNSLVEDYEIFENNSARAGFSCEKKKVTIRVTTIDSACKELAIKPKFIKMDIEGAELEAIQGMQETLLSVRPIVLLEISRQHKECLDQFKAAGYKVMDDALQPADERLFDCGETWPGPLNFFFVPA